MLFAFPVAIAVPITGGFLLGGPALGFLAAVLVAIVIVVAAIRMEPREWRRSAARGQPGAPVEPAPDGTEVGGSRRAGVARVLAALALGAAGIVVIAATEGTWRIIGWGVLAVAISVMVSLMFLEVGYSDDRARAREQRPRRRPRHGDGSPHRVN
jgi:membrane-associated phospholipid phosphatase